ncbi:MAG: thioredoxin family protein [bacterium]
MKVLGFSFLFFLMFSYLLSYVEPDQGGLFTKIVRSGGAGQEKSQVAYEPREQIEHQSCDINKNSPDNTDQLVAESVTDMTPESLVFNIQGMAQFTKLVVKNSYSKPVVLKIYSPMSQDSGKVAPVFQAVADEFKNQVIFAGLNVAQNMDIFMQISMFYKLKKVDLPLFLFYKDGQLLMPFLAGFQPQNYLSGYIQRKFFVHDDDVRDIAESVETGSSK